MQISCPEHHCKSKKVIKNGLTHHGKQNQLCNKCGRQFCQLPSNKIICNTTKAWIRKLLLERISLLGICWSADVSLTWLLSYISQIYQDLPGDLNLQFSPQNKVLLFRVEADEMWGFVGKKKNKKWIWIAMDPNTKQVLAFYVGDRSARSATQLYQAIPEEYRLNAQFYTGDYDSYKSVLPTNRHTIGKRWTTHIERLNNTIRQRGSRLVRKALSFLKKLDNHKGALTYFFCNYHLEKAVFLK